MKRDAIVLIMGRTWELNLILIMVSNMLLTRGRGSAESESEPMENTYTSLHAVNTEAPTGVREEVVPVAEDAEITDNDTM